MSRKASPIQRPRHRRPPSRGLDTEDRPGSLLQLPVCLGNDDFDDDNGESRTVTVDRGHVEALYLLAQTCNDKSERIRWLTRAAERNHVRAMHDLGLASAALHERRRWLREAARHGWAEAMAELGDVECS